MCHGAITQDRACIMNVVVANVASNLDTNLKLKLLLRVAVASSFWGTVVALLLAVLPNRAGQGFGEWCATSSMHCTGVL